eukprot:976608-Rhodomonas_salina.1
MSTKPSESTRVPGVRTARPLFWSLSPCDVGIPTGSNSLLIRRAESAQPKVVSAPVVLLGTATHVVRPSRPPQSLPGYQSLCPGRKSTCVTVHSQGPTVRVFECADSEENTTFAPLNARHPMITVDARYTGLHTAGQRPLSGHYETRSQVCIAGEIPRRCLGYTRSHGTQRCRDTGSVAQPQEDRDYSVVQVVPLVVVPGETAALQPGAAGVHGCVCVGTYPGGGAGCFRVKFLQFISSESYRNFASHDYPGTTTRTNRAG